MKKHSNSQPEQWKERSLGLMIATSVFGLLYLAFIVLSFIPAQAGSLVSSAVPFKPFDLEQICVKLLFLLFLVGYFAAWKNEGVAGIIFLLWYGGMWCLELLVVAPLRNSGGGGIVMGLPVFVLGILFIVHWHKGECKEGLYWTPRVLGILLAVFVGIFALDVFGFGEGYGFWETILALVMHLISAMLVLTALVIAWRWEAVGGILLIALGIWYLATTLAHLDWCLIISGPLFLTGGLFLTDWAYRAKPRHGV